MAKQKQWMAALSLTGRKRVDGVGRDVDEVALADRPILLADGHDPPAPEHVVELVRGVGMGLDPTSPRHLELVHQLEEAPLGGVPELAGIDHPPHGHGAVVLDDRRGVLDVAYVHRHGRGHLPFSRFIRTRCAQSVECILIPVSG